ncbi:MAG: HAMP domain-containing protein [bacterium]|nr:HAMP domain-containing protein [bacterium]
MEERADDKSRRANKIVGLLSFYFLRLSIAKKIFVGYAFLVALLIIITIFVLTTLNNLNSINRSILEVDVPVINASKSMTNVLLAQDSYIRRFAILKTPDLLKAFRERSAEFDDSLEMIASFPEERGFPVGELSALHKEFNTFLINGYKKLEDKSSKEADIFNKGVRERQDKIIGILKSMAAEALLDQDKKVTSTSTIGNTAFEVAALICIIGFIISITAAVFITINISHAVNRLKSATERIAEGDFDYVPDITNKDEVGDLARAFVSMAGRLKKLEEMYKDASPLTRLPGGIAIENVMKKRIIENEKIAFCLMDLDNFKAYNDHYGYAKGNDLIIATAEVVDKAVEKFGAEGDFIGHIGGDDFVLITGSESYNNICKNVVEEFDKKVPAFYDEEDRSRGYIQGEDRHGNKRKFPLASISIAVVTNTNRKLENHIEFGEIAADLKEYAKSMDGSVYVVDHRREGAGQFHAEDKGVRGKVVKMPERAKKDK